MIEKARLLGVYDRLEQGDVIEFLDGSEDGWDLILAADVFIYVGDLEPVFARLERAMAEGVFCFSVESLEDDGAGVRLLPSLRFAHSEPYLARLASRHGFEVVAIKHAPVREEQREAIEGLYVVMRKAPAPVRPQATLGKLIGPRPRIRGGAFIDQTGQTAHDLSPLPRERGVAKPAESR